MTPAHFYAYIFFRVPPELRGEKKENKQVKHFFEQWEKDYALQSAEPFDLLDPDLTMLCLAANDSTSVCLFRFHDLDIFEIEWCQTPDDASVSAFREKRSDELNRHRDNMPPCFGMAFALFTHSDNSLTENVSEYAEIFSFGKIYNIKTNDYVLIAEDETAEPADFLGRDFPVMLSCLRKIEFEYGELGKIQAGIDESKERINVFLQREDSEDIENVLEMKKIGTDLQKNISLLGKLKLTLDINILNLEKYIEKYHIHNDTIFAPFLKDAKHICQQTEYDLKYARLTLDAYDSHVQVLDLIVKSRHEKNQKWTDWLIALLIIPIGIAQIGAALGWKWSDVLEWIVISVFLICIFRALWQLR
ncbi:MAG: hypothetical protein BWK80_12480 [Desulfobacteraceae bacterium IS3]|nr:MAG: hypothetical protein BWK80_12480 [Desulfobacteraceae bacterium IS3]